MSRGRTVNHLFNSGETIGNIVIKQQIRMKINRKTKNGDNVTRKGYLVECLKCHYEFEDAEMNIEKKMSNNNTNFCPVCANKRVVKGINDVATTHPEFIKYFVNINDCYENTYGSNKYVELKCPDCGNIKIGTIHNLTNHNFRCTHCSDGISLPEKIMGIILRNLNIKFIKQYTPEWSRGKRYDFYLEDFDFIIETHGSQHYDEKRASYWKSYEEEHENDMYKYDLAVIGSYEYDKNYFIVDCRKSNVEYIVKSLKNSKLSDFFDWSKIDLDKLKYESMSSLMIEVCEYRNKHKCKSLDIEEKFKISRQTVIEYLKRGNEIGLCEYNPKEEMKKGYEYSNKKGCNTWKENFKSSHKGKAVEIYKNDILINTFQSASELSRQSIELFGDFLDIRNISAVALGKRASYKGYYFKYVDDYAK